jgi:hypothetical protein
MSTAVQRRRGTTAQHSSFAGLNAELTVDTDKEVVVVHDGATAGGYPMMRENGSNSALALGSAGTPSLKFTGDTNTGIYSPGADQVAISTNGNGRLFVTSLGRVGVNTDSPGFIFQIEHSTQDGIRLRTANTSDSHIDFADTDANGRGRINYDHATDSMGFRTAGSERMRLDSSGRLGLGTSSPNATLEIGTSGPSPTATFQVNGTATFNTGGFGTLPGVRILTASDNPCLRFYRPSGGSPNSYVYQLNVSGDNFTIGYVQADRFSETTFTERFRIDSSGRVGIGTSSPAAQLHVASTDGTIYQQATRGTGTTWRLQTSGSNGQSYELYDLTSNQRAFIYQNATGAEPGWTFNTAGTARMYIDGSGRVGIGTTSPTFAASYTGLHLDGGANGPAVRLTNSTTGSTATDGFDIILQQGGSDGYIWQRESASIILGTAATERARIDSSGRLLVGTSSSRAAAGVQWGLQLEGTSYTGASFIGNSTSAGIGGFLVLGKSKSSSIGSTTAVANGDVLGEIDFVGANGTDLSNIGGQIQCIVDAEPFTSGDTTDLPSRLVFSTTADGASSPTERMRLTSTGQLRLAGAGITFNGDTAAANQLDDYEEGTFTPAIAGDGTAGTGTYSFRNGNYIKVGSLVMARITMTWNSHTGTGIMQFTGLPFAPTKAGTGSAYINNVALTANTVPVPYWESGMSYFLLLQNTVGGGAGGGYTTMDAAGDINATIVYSVQ